MPVFFGFRYARVRVGYGKVHILEAVQKPAVFVCVSDLTLLAKGLREHEYGSVWSWEDLQVWMNLDYNPNDIRVINRINADNANTTLATTVPTSCSEEYSDRCYSASCDIVLVAAISSLRKSRSLDNQAEC